MQMACVPAAGKPPRHEEGAQLSSQEAADAGDSDDDQAVKVLHAFRSEVQNEDPAFEKELAALLGSNRLTGDAGLTASAAHAPADDASAGSVVFQVVLRKVGGRDSHSRTVQASALLLVPVDH